MTHCYAACMLLEHGPLTRRQFWEITGWGNVIADAVLENCRRRGWVRHVSLPGVHRYLYELA